MKKRDLPTLRSFSLPIAGFQDDKKMIVDLKHKARSHSRVTGEGDRVDSVSEHGMTGKGEVSRMTPLWLPA